MEKNKTEKEMFVYKILANIYNIIKLAQSYNVAKNKKRCYNRDNYLKK